jgi:hypothetical protein
MANFSNDVWMASTGAASFYPHTIDQSLRFDDGDSARLADTMGTPTDTDKATISVWVKRGQLTGVNQTIIEGYNGSSGTASSIYFDASNRLHVAFGGGGGALTTNAVFRDVSAWYHILVAFNSFKSNSTKRCKIYVNGQEITSFSSSSYPNRYQEQHMFASGSNHRIGSNWNNTGNFFDGYMAEFNGIDGTDLTPSSFGELKDSIWVPKDVSGLTYGTNGFHLDFADGSAIGNDVSGQNNDWTTSGLVASDVMLDSPTNTFAVLNVLDNATALSEGSLAQTGNANWRASRSTFKLPASGKWYFEATTTVNSQRIILGVAVDSMSLTSSAQGLTGFVGMAIDSTNANAQNNQSSSTNLFVNTGSSGRKMLVQMAIDCDTGKMWFGYNGDFYNSSGDATGNPSAGTNETVTLSNPENFFPLVQSYDNNNKIVANFGQDSSFAGNRTSGSAGASDANGHADFFYSPPSSFLALCSANMPEPAIIDGSEYFNTVLYTGNGGTQSITGVGFQPDWVWMKSRDEGSSSYTGHNVVQDSVRGVGTDTGLVTNENYGEATAGYSDALTAFDSDGFTLGARNQVNYNNDAFVSWNWLAGTAVSGNTTGSGTAKTYTGSVNTESGFSIIKYVGNGTPGHTIPHNLTVGGVATTPTMIIVKRLDANGGWRVQHKDVPATNLVSLHTNTASFVSDTFFNDTAFNSTVFTVGSDASINSNDKDYIAYCFTDIEGFSKAGMYFGNSSANGTYVHTGFRVAWLMVKDRDNTGSWYIWDNKRSYNEMNDRLVADLSAAETADREVDFLSNGFKLRESNNAHNTSGREYIYLAFAEQPFKYSNAK